VHRFAEPSMRFSTGVQVCPRQTSAIPLLHCAPGRLWGFQSSSASGAGTDIGSTAQPTTPNLVGAIGPRSMHRETTSSRLPAASCSFAKLKRGLAGPKLFLSSARLCQRNGASNIAAGGLRSGQSRRVELFAVGLGALLSALSEQMHWLAQVGEVEADECPVAAALERRRSTTYHSAPVTWFRINGSLRAVLSKQLLWLAMTGWVG